MKQQRSSRSPTDSFLRSKKLVYVVLGLAIGVLSVELIWFSTPVQDWMLARRSSAELLALARQKPGALEVRIALIRQLLSEKRNSDALSHGIDAVRMDPNSPAAHELAGTAAARLGDLDQARHFLERSRNLGSRSAGVTVELARLELESQSMGDAVRLLEPLVQRHPDVAEAWHLLARARASLGIPDGWKEAALRATKLDPRNPDYLAGLAEAHLFSDEPEPAIAASQRAVAAAPQNPLPWSVLGRSLARRSDTASLGDAERALRRAIDLAARMPDDDGLAQRELGALLLSTNRPAEAVPPLEAAVRLRPPDQQAAYLLSQAYRRSGNVKLADRMTALWEKLTETARAIRYLESRVQADPYNARLRLDLAKLLEADGQTEMAARHRESAKVIRRKGRN